MNRAEADAFHAPTPSYASLPRDRAIDVAIAPLGTVILLPDPDFRRRVGRCVSHVGPAFVAQ
jgi:hypothetical protein